MADAAAAEDVQVGAARFRERVPLGTGPQLPPIRDYTEAPPVALFDAAELASWGLWRAAITEFVATLVFLYLAVNTIVGHLRDEEARPGSGAGIRAIAWTFGGAIFVLVYATAGISGGHLNPAVTFAFLLARKVSLPRFFIYSVAQCLGAVAGVGLVKGWQTAFFDRYGAGAANIVNHGYTKGTGLGAEIVGTFVLVHTVFSATDAKRNARDSHVPILAPLPIGFAVFLVILATLPITGTGINPARSFGVAAVVDHAQVWRDHWVFWVGPFIGAGLATAYYDLVIRARPFKSSGSSGRHG